MKRLYIHFALLQFIILGSWSCTSEKTVEPTLSETKVEQKATPRSKRAPGDKDTAGIYENYKNTNRFVWQKPNIIIDLLGDLSGKSVADIGTGFGYFALRMAKEADKVIAIDIEERMLEYLDSVKVFELTNPEKLETRLGASEDPRLALEEVDGIIIVNTYMFIPDRQAYLKTLKNGLKKGGKLLIVDFKRKRTPFGPPAKNRVPLFQVEEELYASGFKNVKTIDMQLDYQYIIIGEK